MLGSVRGNARGDTFDEPINIDISPMQPQAVDVTAPVQRPRHRRSKPKSKRDHINGVHLNFRFPNLDFVDWPGLTPAQCHPTWLIRQVTHGPTLL